MAVLVAYEESGKTTASLRAVGVEAYSNDILPTRGNPDWHIQGDAMEVIFSRRWDGIIAHPVCTRMANSGAKHLYLIEGRMEQAIEDAKQFRHIFDNAPTARLVMENPIMHCHARNITGRQSQVIQPWMFGYKEMKATCLWIRGLPLLQPTDIVGPPPKCPIGRRTWAKVHRCPPGPLRSRIRSETCQGYADAFAEQYGPYFTGEKIL